MSIAASLKECHETFRKVFPYGQEPTDEGFAKWFDTPANDVKGAADMKNRANRMARWYLGRLENLVGDGYCVGSSLSLADVMLYNMLAETMTDAEAPSADFPAWKREPFANGAKTAALLKDHPKLSAIVATVASNENLKKWLAMRGEQKF